MQVRKSVVKMAVNRGVIAAAKLIRDKRALQEPESYPLKSIGFADLTEGLSAQKMDDEVLHHYVHRSTSMAAFRLILTEECNCIDVATQPLSKSFNNTPFVFMALSH